MGLYKEEKKQESRQHNRVRSHKDSVQKFVPRVKGNKTNVEMFCSP